MEAILYCTVSKLEMKRSFESLEELMSWFKHFEKRNFLIGWYKEAVWIGFTPGMDEKDVEENTGSIEAALREGAELEP